MEPFYQNESATIYFGNSLVVLPTLTDNSVDALVTDPPAGISFMGKDWDDFRRSHNLADAGRDNVFGRTSAKAPEYGRSPRAAFVDAMTLIFRECFRVMKPGAHGLVWSIPRTSHWAAWALEDAGFEIRDRITHIFGSGFPKSLNIQRSVDSALCVLPGRHYWTESSLPKGSGAKLGDHVCPFTDKGREYEGQGTALKPSCEDWWLVRKPVEGTIAGNVQCFGTGSLNVDSCRLGTGDNLNGGAYADSIGERYDGAENWRFKNGGARQPMPGDDREGAALGMFQPGKTAGEGFVQPEGRWPSHLVFSHSADCELLGTRSVESNGHYPASRGSGGIATSGHAGQSDLEESFTGKEEIENWCCADDCPVRLLDEQSGDRKAGGNLSGMEPSRTGGEGTVAYGKFDNRREWNSYSDVGGASRFFYCAKASVEDREEGLQDLIARARDESRKEGNPGGDNPRNRGVQPRKNHHPTVKPTSLMRYLCRLITQPGGVVLDPFMGSGSTGKAAYLEGLRFIGIDKDKSYCEIAARRCELRQRSLFAINE